MFRIFESKLESSILNSERDMENYNSIKMDHWKRGSGFACNSIKSLSDSNNPNFCGDIERIFIELFFLNQSQFGLECYIGHLTNLNW